MPIQKPTTFRCAAFPSKHFQWPTDEKPVIISSMQLFAFAEAFHLCKQINRLDRALYTLALFTLIMSRFPSCFVLLMFSFFNVLGNSLIILCRSDAFNLCSNLLMLCWAVTATCAQAFIYSFVWNVWNKVESGSKKEKHSEWEVKNRIYNINTLFIGSVFFFSFRLTLCNRCKVRWQCAALYLDFQRMWIRSSALFCHFAHCTIGMYDCSVDVLSTLCIHFVESLTKTITTFKHLNESASHEMRSLNFNSHWNRVRHVLCIIEAMAQVFRMTLWLKRVMLSNVCFNGFHTIW